MCGITGIYFYNDISTLPDVNILNKMTDILSHRGPDGRGIYIGDGIGLGHRRLAVIDTSEAGKQPMCNQNKDIWIVYNGEIYNFKDIKKELQSKGYIFKSQTDTEVILYAYQEWGIDCLDRISGIFAFCIWDSNRKRLWLVRDPIGVKPLFYYDDGKKVYFASEIKAILCDPSIKRDMDYKAIDSYFSFYYTPAPMTGINNIKQLLPGEWILYENGSRFIKKYFDLNLDKIGRFKTSDYNDIADSLDSKLVEVVNKQTISDVPLGCFLSGGVDSTAILRALSKKNNKSVINFTLGFNATTFDEVFYAEKVAEIYNSQVIKEYIDIDAIDLLEKVSYFAEDPIGDPSMLAYYVLCNKARNYIKVALSGDGADELFAGYETYQASYYASYYRKVPEIIKKAIIDNIVKLIPITNSKYSLYQKISRFIYGAKQGDERDHCYWRIIFTKEMKDNLYSEDFKCNVSSFDSIEAYERQINKYTSNKLDRLLYGDLTFYLPNDMLVKVDRMSMASGLEVRVPFLDLDIVKLSFSIPEEFKLYKNKIKKYILKKILEKEIPSKILNRPKSGFNIPIEKWFRDKEVIDYFINIQKTVNEKVKNILNIDYINRLLSMHINKKQDNSYALFCILMFYLWFRNMFTTDSKYNI